MPIAEVIGVCDFNEIRAVDKDIEELLPERKQGSVRLPGKEEDGVIRRTMREVFGARCNGLQNLKILRRVVGSSRVRHFGLPAKSEEVAVVEEKQTC